MAKMLLSAAAAWAACANLAGAAPPSVDVGNPVDYPHAGIALAVPKGFEARPLGAPYDVMNAVVTEDDKPVHAVTLSTFPIAGKGTAEEFADAKMAELKKNLAIRHLTLLKKTAMPVAGLNGSARLMSYTFRGAKTVAAQVYFLRDLPNVKTRVCYLLTVVCAAEKQNGLLPILGVVVKSARLTPVRHPSLAPDCELAPAMEDFQLGYSVRPPKGWYASKSRVGLEMGQVDYLVGGLPMPALQLMVTSASGEAATSEACSKKYLGMAKSVAAERQQNVQVVSEGPTTLGELPAYQFVLIQSSKEAGSPPRGEGTPESLVLAHRTACVPGAGSEGPRVYMLILTARGDEGRAAAALLDRIAAGFKLVEITTQPTTQPTTRPSTQPTTEPANRPGEEPAADKDTTSAPPK